MMKHLYLLMLGFVCWLTGCDKESLINTQQVEVGTWRMGLTLPGGELPFLVELTYDDKEFKPVAYLINGAERALVTDVSIEENRLRIHWPVYNATIEGVWENRLFHGFLTMVHERGIVQQMPLTGEFRENYRFFPEARTPQIEVSGTWDVTFTDDADNTTKAIGKFRQKGHLLYGTFLAPGGDYRYLAGEVRADSVYLSCFDGGHAFLFKARQKEDKSLEGEFWSGAHWHERWTAVWNEEVRPPDPYSLTVLKDGHQPFDFHFPDLDSNLVSPLDQGFRGKVVLVIIAGSWCPNCHDEAGFLASFYHGNQQRGLEIIALMYERYREFKSAVRQVKRFRKKFGIDYKTLIAGSFDKGVAPHSLPMLEGVSAIPMTIFIDRRGKVRKILTGFRSPAASEYYQQQVSDFTSLVNTLLDE